MTKRTCKRAAHLRADTQCPAIDLGYIDRFDLVAASDPHQIFAGTIGADLFGNHLRHGQHKLTGQFGAVIFRQVGHLIKRPDAFLINPLPDLIAAHLGFFFCQPMLYQGLNQRRAG